MLPGPVFAIELLTTARRARYYALRALYGAVLLVVLWGAYHAFFDNRYVDFSRGYLAPGLLAEFARLAFSWFSLAQGLTVLVITPSLVAGTIASEKQRKTLHYLLASDLTSREIVLGKLFARLLMVLVFILAGVPILFFLTMFGGISIELILLTFGVTITAAVFFGSISIFYSAVMRQARGAIVATYLTIAAFLIVPLLAEAATHIFPDKIDWLPQVVAFFNPIINTGPIFQLARTGYIYTSITQMEILQWVYSVLLVAFATWKLRPIAAKQDHQPKAILRIDKKGQWRWRALPRPSCGNDPMLWKEIYTARVGGVAKMIGLFNNLFWAVLVGCLTFDYARTAILEVWRVGYGGESTWSYREEFNGILRGLTGWVFGFWVLGTASTAASSIASEREDDTWTNLVSTMLTSPEIIRAKIVGSILRFRWIGLMLLIMWGVGVIAGAVTIRGWLLAVAEASIFLWFAAALGVRNSLRSKSTGRSLTLTIGALLFLNGGYLMCLFPFMLGDFATLLFGVMPYLISKSLLSSKDLTDFDAFLTNPRRPGYGYWNTTRYPMSYETQAWLNHPIVPSMIGVSLYLMLAIWLTWSSMAWFDEAAERPYRLLVLREEAPPPTLGTASPGLDPG